MVTRGGDISIRSGIETRVDDDEFLADRDGSHLDAVRAVLLRHGDAQRDLRAEDFRPFALEQKCAGGRIVDLPADLPSPVGPGASTSKLTTDRAAVDRRRDIVKSRHPLAWRLKPDRAASQGRTCSYEYSHVG